MNKKIIISLVVAGIGVATVLNLALVGAILKKNDNLGLSASLVTPSFVFASSSTLTITTTSQRVLASSTPTRRLGAVIQPIGCPTNGGVFLKADNDKVATANTGMFAFASTTFAMNDYPNAPYSIQGAVQGITAAGTCTVLVTEYRSQY